MRSIETMGLVSQYPPASLTLARHCSSVENPRRQALLTCPDRSCGGDRQSSICTSERVDRGLQLRRA